MILVLVLNTVAVMLAGPDDHRRGGSYSRTALLPKPQQTSLADLLHELSTSDRQELFFMQLPDCVPGQLSEQKDAPPLRSPTEKAAKKEGKAEDRRHLQSLVSQRKHNMKCCTSTSSRVTTNESIQLGLNRFSTHMNQNQKKLSVTENRKNLTQFSFVLFQ